ncbi:DNA-directed DNA polymerase alpha subunit pol12 [Agyrium rufum]|nr:DNA-directed DNA polymerase alpha subunit pol12 [Agyrium rufum]
MTTLSTELNDRFQVQGHQEIPADILGELLSAMRLHALSPQELFYKWESYSIKMGSEDTKMDYDTVLAFKKDMQEMLEREKRGKVQLRSREVRGVHATPRNARAGGDLMDILEGSTPRTPQTASSKGTTKRKAPFETPMVPKVNKSAMKSSPTDGRTNGVNNHGTAPFSERKNAGQIIETLNDQLPPREAPLAPPSEPRVKLTANTDIKRFSYRPMAMHLSEASEVLDDRIDEFLTLIQEHHKLEDSAFGNASAKSTSEIVAVGRIACDTPEGKLNAASVVLESSRRTGAGRRIPLQLDEVTSQGFFPGQIVAVRGINASGKYFAVNEVLEVPLLPLATSVPSEIEAAHKRLGVEDDSDLTSPSNALNVLVASGPYTADDNLDFEPLAALCETAQENYSDVLILVGPFLDTDHPLIATGDFELPDDASIEPDKATLSDVFRILIASKLRQLAQAVPSITIVMVPSVRDAVSKHVSWPQDVLPKRELGLPKQARMVSNPVTISINEIVIGISAQDVLHDLRREEVYIGKPKEMNVLARLPRHVIEQGHFFPVYPPTDRTQLPRSGTEDGIANGTPIDVAYLKLGEWLNARPDLLILPSTLTPFVKVVECVLVVNPGGLSKRKGPGTYAAMSVYPRKLTEEERASEDVRVDHQLFERARVDMTRI